MNEMPALPKYGDKVRCINNDTRPELTVGQVYVVETRPDLEKMPLNPERWYGDDFRYIAIVMPGQKERGIFPMCCFEKA
jgi:hypothetical protein